MKRLMHVGTATFASAIGVLFLFSLLDIGVASAAPPFYGQKYSQAAQTTKNVGQTPAIATVIGSQLAIDDCVVVNSYMSITLNSQGRSARGATRMFDLNCNLPLAEPGKPGNSLATQVGQDAKQDQIVVSNWNKGIPGAVAAGTVPWCGVNATHAQSCMDRCDRTNMCSGEVLQYLASIIG